MKKVSILSLFIFTAFILISGAAISQETVSTDDTATVATEEKAADTTAKTEAATTEHLTMEDTASEHAEKVYDKEDVQLLKGQPKTFTDGYNTYVNDKVRFELFDMDNVMKEAVMYKIDDKEEQKYTEPFTLADEGSHVIYYYSIDKMGNKEAMKSINVILDKTAPLTLVTINAPFSKNGENIYASETFTYNYTVSAKDNISVPVRHHV